MEDVTFLRHQYPTFAKAEYVTLVPSPLSQNLQTKLQLLHATAQELTEGKPFLHRPVDSEFVFDPCMHLFSSNALIMGRKTWFSIPEKMRPLPGRINIVLSQTLSKAPAGAHLASSLNEAVEMVTSGPLAAHTESIFIIGGSTVYHEAISSVYPCRLYVTRVLRDYECDTFFPKVDWSSFKEIFVSDIPSEILTENGIDFKFEVFEKV